MFHDKLEFTKLTVAPVCYIETYNTDVDLTLWTYGIFAVQSSKVQHATKKA